ncbi:STAS domain-containing protein [Jatrophihabitans fulvus]
MNLTVQAQPTDDSGTAVIEVVGSIDVASRDRLADATRTALDSGASTIVLDLAGVSFIDSTGIGTLVDAAGAASEAGGSLLVRDPSRPVERILEVAGLAGQWDERGHVAG